MDFLIWLLPDLTYQQWIAHCLVFVVNIGLLLCAKPILSLIDTNGESDARVSIFRSLNILVLILHILDLILLKVSGKYENYFIKVGLTLMSVYAAMFFYSLCCFWSRRRFGAEKTLDGNTVYLDTYSTRLVDFLLLAIIALTTIYALIKIWGADSMLETTGIFGIIAALLAFTSNIWAPDIIGGLIILNTQILEDGDVVTLEGYPDEYIISKVTLIYVILYDIRNNHRTLIRNSQFTQRKIDNLSRIASPDGIRQAIKYKIGYPELDAQDKDKRRDQLKSFRNRIDRMFEEAFENCCNQQDIKINANRKFEWLLTQTGDHALEYTLWIYLERIPNTKVTSTIRRHLMGTVYRTNECVHAASVSENLSLSTPVLANLQPASTVEIEATA